MKKSVKILLDKMESPKINRDGSVQGGFASIRGGFNQSAESTNQENCSNIECTHTTNFTKCVNVGTCFI